MIASLLALSLAAAPVLPQEEWTPPPEEEENARRFFLSAWGGEVLGGRGNGRSSSFFGGEAAWALRALDLGVAGYGYRDLPESDRAWTPVVLLRLTERFRTRGGAEAAFTVGVGSGRPRGWVAWFQVALGVRIPLGPIFLGGELAFEQYDHLRLGAGLGLAF